jgi:DNA (cytosine-5)-methyltransferase 1
MNLDANTSGRLAEAVASSNLRSAAQLPRLPKKAAPGELVGAEIFAGCGGLALGMSRAGFKHAVMAEINAPAVKTAKFNKARGIEYVAAWPIEITDVREIDWTQHAGKLAVISGGPPCQPFGIGGKKNGPKDSRDMWPEAIRAVREARPDSFLFENVRNLAGPKFSTYLDWITSSLRRPMLARANESYLDHLARLHRDECAEEYSVAWQVANAADYGAPQIRFRVIVFGVSVRMGISAQPMRPTHSRDRLLWDQYVTGDYWKRHGLERRSEPVDGPDASRVATLRTLKRPPPGLPWVTTRDALNGLGKPNDRDNHVLQPGARIYPGHTGSLLDKPAKALKAGDHGVPGGENMVVEDSGEVRYFSVREAARLVGLPDDYLFPGSWTESMRQLGNAVPVQLAQAAGNWLRRAIVSPKTA